MKPDDIPGKRIRILVDDDIREIDPLSRKLDNYIERQASAQEYGNDRRRAPRIKVELDALISVRQKENELIFAPAVIKNISTTGLLLELVDKGHFPVGRAEHMQRFEVGFFLPGDDAPITIACRPTRIRITDGVVIGAEFLAFPLTFQRYPM